MNELEPREGDHFHRDCSFCKHDVPYFSMPWRVVRDRWNNLIRRRMGQCPTCGQWVKPVLVLADEHDNRGWILEPVDPYEVEQAVREQS